MNPLANNHTVSPTAKQPFERWFLFASVAGLLGCFGWLYLGLPWPKCWVRHMLGIPCPTCGSTRCAFALVHGQLGRAFLLNPLMCTVYLSVLIVDLYAGSVVFFGAPAVRVPATSSKIKKTLAITFVVTVIANWIYLILHR